MKRCLIFLLAPLACVPALAEPANTPALAASFDLHRPEIVAFINEVTERDGLKRKEVQRLLKQARPQPKIIDMMNRPIEKVAPWWEYREHFVNAERVGDGAQFWAEHRESLERVAATYQVPPEAAPVPLSITRPSPDWAKAQSPSIRWASKAAVGNQAWVKSGWPSWMAKSSTARPRY